MTTCQAHPKYKAIRKPKVNCSDCWAIYNEKHQEPKPEEPVQEPEKHCGLCGEGEAVPIAVISGFTLHLNPFESGVFWPCAKEYDLIECKRCVAGEPLAYDNRKVLLHRTATMDFECPIVDKKNG